MDMHFCRRCGSPLTNVENHIFKCSSGHNVYANAAPAAGIFFVAPDKNVLLSVRGVEPHKGMLDAFGGFLDGSETFEEAAKRELHEELSLQPEDYEGLNYLTSAVGNFPFKGEVVPVISVFFWTRLRTKKPLVPSDDVAALKSIPLREVDPASLHDDDIRAGIRALQELFTSKHPTNTA